MNHFKKLLRQIGLWPRDVRWLIRYWKHRTRFRKLGGRIDVFNPRFGEDSDAHGIDFHYFHQGIWTARHLAQDKPGGHVDVGSQDYLVGHLSTLTQVTSVELRPLPVATENLFHIRGSVTDLPFQNDSVRSLSCLHVAEHIGLGRYGDPLDPDGTEKACRELARVLAPSGILYFSVPIGRERIEFNAHRVHRPQTILNYFGNLRLDEFSAVTDQGSFVRDADITAFDDARYALGLFRFTKKSS